MEEQIIPWQKLMLHHKVVYLDHLYEFSKETFEKLNMTNCLQYANWKFTVSVYMKGSGTHLSYQDQSKSYCFQVISFLQKL